MLVDGLYGPLRVERGSFQEAIVSLYRRHERRRGLYRDLLSASLKNPQSIIDGLIEYTLMEPPRAGPTSSQQVAFIRALRGVNWKNVFRVEDTEYADDRAAKELDPIMKHYV